MEQNHTPGKIALIFAIIGNTLSQIIVQYALLIAKYQFRLDAMYIPLYIVSFHIAWNYWMQLKRKVAKQWLRYLIVLSAFLGLALLIQFGGYR